MKRLIITLSAAVITAGTGVGALLAQDVEIPPSKVTGGGQFQDGYYTEDGAFKFGDNLHSFSVMIDPGRPDDRKSPKVKVNVRLAGPEVEAFWGGPLHLRDDYELCLVLDWFGPESKPGQMFRFAATDRDGREVAVWVFIHDNLTPGLNRANPSWSDWVMVWVEPAMGDWEPESPDDLFFAAGVMVRGNIMDHRKGYSY